MNEMDAHGRYITLAGGIFAHEVRIMNTMRMYCFPCISLIPDIDGHAAPHQHYATNMTCRKSRQETS